MSARALVLEGARVEVDGAAVTPPEPRGAWIWEAGALDPAAGLTLWPVPRRRPDGTARPPSILPLARAVELRLVELEAEPEPEPEPEHTPAPSTWPPPSKTSPPPEPEPQGLAVVWFEGIDPEPAHTGALSWPRLRARLTRFPELAAGLDKRAAPGWAPFAWAPEAPHRRAAANVGALSALVLDFDKLPPGGLADLEAELALRRSHYETVRERLKVEEERTLKNVLPLRYNLRGEAQVYPISVEIRLPGGAA